MHNLPEKRKIGNRMSYRLALLLLLHDRSRFGVRAFLTARTSSSHSSYSSSSHSHSPSRRLLSSKEESGGFFDDYDDFVTNLNFDRGGWDNSGGPVASSSSSDRGGGGGRGRDYGSDSPRGRGGRGGGGRGGFRTSGETMTHGRACVKMPPRILFLRPSLFFLF